MTLLLGWDVGAWHCDKGDSRDALCALTGSGWNDLRLAVPPWWGNLRSALVSAECPGSILTTLGLGAADTGTVTIAIDTPLGWPSAFVALLGGKAELPAVSHASHANPYLFRATEQGLVARGLLPKGRTPLSAVRDMIGSQSSKGLYFLRKAGMTQSAPAVWARAEWTAIETYPTPVRTSRTLQPHFARLRGDPLFVKALVSKKAEKDLDDSLWCALVAAMWSFSRQALTPAPADEVIASEGWIWAPSDCCTPTDAPADEVAGGDASE